MGYLLLDKPAGCTSFDALRPVKRALKTGKIGHTGTLDKFATGLLVVLEGRDLKLSRFFTHCDKSYEGTVCFGMETDTLDPEGAVVAEAPPPSRAAVEEVLEKFTGRIMQAPPLYSAVHINGKRAHEIARGGGAADAAVVMKSRPVFIHRLNLISYEAAGQTAVARIAVRCSSGAYIRSLARDLALAASSRAHLVQLRRTSVADFSVEDALRLPLDATAGTPNVGIKRQDGTAENPDPYGIARARKSVDRRCFEQLRLPIVDIDEQNARALRHGRPLTPLFPLLNTCNAPTAALFHGPRLVALVEKSPQGWGYGFVHSN
ncbi:MAG: tRNA pseudouridine(55) synthase TruB [Spirochaetaceae bacterium]|nr:tRNA pseudouridine(55) synthase TruB [Spirochaetaceae bacterium]